MSYPPCYTKTQKIKNAKNHENKFSKLTRRQFHEPQFMLRQPPFSNICLDEAFEELLLFLATSQASVDPRQGQSRLVKAG